MTRFAPYSAAYPKGHVLQRDDRPAMVDAIVWRFHQRIAFARVSPYQLKIGPSLSFYPVKGTLMYDGQLALPVRDLVSIGEGIQCTSTHSKTSASLTLYTYPIEGAARGKASTKRPALPVVCGAVLVTALSPRPANQTKPPAAA